MVAVVVGTLADEIIKARQCIRTLVIKCKIANKSEGKSGRRQWNEVCRPHVGGASGVSPWIIPNKLACVFVVTETWVTHFPGMARIGTPFHWGYSGAALRFYGNPQWHQNGSLDLCRDCLTI